MAKKINIFWECSGVEREKKKPGQAVAKAKRDENGKIVRKHAHYRRRFKTRDEDKRIETPICPHCGIKTQLVDHEFSVGTSPI